MKKISILIIGLLALMITNNANGQEVVPQWTYFTFDKNIMNQNVDLNTATLTIKINATKENGQLFDGTFTMPATTHQWSPGLKLMYGNARVSIDGPNAYAYSGYVYFSGSPTNIIIHLDVYLDKNAIGD